LLRAKAAAIVTRPGKRLTASVVNAHRFPKNVRGASYAVCSDAPGQSRGGPAGFIHLLNFSKMFHIFLALWLAFACPAHHTNGNNTHPVNATADSGPGDYGHVPPPPPPPPGG